MRVHYDRRGVVLGSTVLVVTDGSERSELPVHSVCLNNVLTRSTPYHNHIVDLFFLRVCLLQGTFMVVCAPFSTTGEVEWGNQ